MGVVRADKSLKAPGVGCRDSVGSPSFIPPPSQHEAGWAGSAQVLGQPWVATQGAPALACKFLHLHLCLFLNCWGAWTGRGIGWGREGPGAWGLPCR